MKLENAKLLLDLLRVIDADQPKDFIDSVCAARGAIPIEVEDELAKKVYGCQIDPYLNRVCEMGTKSCLVVHKAP